MPDITQPRDDGGTGKTAAFLVGLVVLLVYVWTAGPTFYWLDSSELTAAAWGLGVAHPPGQPLASLLGRLCCLIPAGTLGFRVSLASALQAAAAAALLTLIAWRLLARLALLGLRQRSLCAALAGLALGLSTSAWFQAVRAEVYALNLLILTAIAHQLLAWEQDRDHRRLLGASLLAGLGLCNHHLLVLLMLPVMLLYVMLSFRSRRGVSSAADPAGAPRPARLVALVAAAGLLGLCTLAYLPLRSRRLPEVDWGAPRTAAGFAWTISARAFQKTVKRAGGQPLGERLGGAAFALAVGLGPVAAVLAAGGLCLLWRRRESRRAALLLSGGVVSNAVSVLLVGFDPFNPDAHGYLVVGVAFLAPGLAVLLGALADPLLHWRRGGPRASAALLLAASLLPLEQGWSSLRASDLRQHWAAEETGRAQLLAPPGALLISSFFETLFNAWALRVTADLRPDLALLHRHFLDQPGYLDDLRRHQPELAAVAAGWAEAGGPGPADLDRLARGRAVLVELDADLPASLQAQLGPAGLLPAWRGPRDEAAILQHLRRVIAWRTAVGPAEENETRRAVTWIHYLLALYGCQEQLPELARRHLRWASELAPLDQRLQQLARRCGAGASRR